MNLEQIETIRKLAETHNFGGVPIPQLCDMAKAYALLRNMATWAYTPHDDMVQLSITFDKQPMRPIHGKVLAADELDCMTGLSTKDYFCALEGFDQDVGNVPKCGKQCETCIATVCERCGRQADEREECTDERCHS